MSLRRPNKRYQITQADRKVRVFEYTVNLKTVRKFFIDNFYAFSSMLDNFYAAPLINGDRMPLHRNEKASHKTLNIKGCETHVKENYSVSREKITAFTQVSSGPNVVVKPELVLKGKDTKLKLNPSEGIKYQWAPKGSHLTSPWIDARKNFKSSYSSSYLYQEESLHLCFRWL